MVNVTRRQNDIEDKKMEKNEIENIVRSYKYPPNIKPYSSDGKIIFEMRGRTGGVTSTNAICLMAPCVNLDGGEFKHLIKFDANTEITEGELIKRITTTVNEAVNCKVKHFVNICPTCNQSI